MSERSGIGWRLWALGAALIALMVVGAVAQWRADHPMVGMVTVAQAPLYLAAAWLVLRRPLASSPRALVAIVAVGAAMRLCVIAAPPVSTDVHRYVWDGRVQAAGINPYRYVPADDALRPLRDEAIYAYINRGDYAPTIYPPAAQMVFFAVTRISETVTAMKIAMVAFEALAVWAILQLLAARGAPRANILLYLWHPLPAWEFAGSGHLDIIAMALLLLAFVAADRGSPLLAGLALAAGTLVKLFPVMAGPALTRRWDWRLPAAFMVGVAVLYAPYLGVGAKVFGFLGGYVAEEGFADGAGFFLWSVLRAVAPLPAQAVVFYQAGAAAILVTVALYRWLRPQGDRADTLTATALIFALLCLLSPHYAWYFCWLVPFLCVHPFAAGLYLTAAATYLSVASWPPTLSEGAGIYGIAIALLLVQLPFRGHQREAPREREFAA